MVATKPLGAMKEAAALDAVIASASAPQSRTLWIEALVFVALKQGR